MSFESARLLSLQRRPAAAPQRSPKRSKLSADAEKTGSPIDRALLQSQALATASMLVREVAMAHARPLRISPQV